MIASCTQMEERCRGNPRTAAETGIGMLADPDSRTAGSGKAIGMKHVICLLALLAALAPATASAGIHAWGASHLTLSIEKNRTASVEMTVSGRPDTVVWEAGKGHCYSHQIAHAHNIQWLKDAKGPYWKVQITANRPGSCEMYFSGGGGETRIGIMVVRY